LKYKLSDVCTIKYGKDHKRLANGTVPVYGSGGIMRYADTALYSKKSVLIPRKGSLSHLYFVKEPFWTVDTLFYTEIDESKVVPEYLYYFLKTLDLAKMNVGTAVPSLTTYILNEIELDIPDLQTQSVIGYTLYALDDKIAVNTRMNYILEQMAQAIFKSWFVNFEPWGGVMPNDWITSNIRRVCNVKGGKRLAKGQKLTTIPNNHPYIRVRDMNNKPFIQMTPSIEFVPDEIQEGISRYIVSTDDVIVSIVGTVGLVCIVHPSLDNANLTENCVKLTNCSSVTSSWLYLFLSSTEGQEQICNVTVGAVQQKLPIKNIQSIAFRLPNNKIMGEFDKIVANLFKTISNNCSENAHLSSLRDILLPRLISGEMSIDR